MCMGRCSDATFPGFSTVNYYRTVLSCFIYIRSFPPRCLRARTTDKVRIYYRIRASIWQKKYELFYLRQYSYQFRTESRNFDIFSYDHERIYIRLNAFYPFLCLTTAIDRRALALCTDGEFVKRIDFIYCPGSLTEIFRFGAFIRVIFFVCISEFISRSFIFRPPDRLYFDLTSLVFERFLFVNT